MAGGYPITEETRAKLRAAGRRQRGREKFPERNAAIVALKRRLPSIRWREIAAILPRGAARITRSIVAGVWWRWRHRQARKEQKPVTASGTREPYSPHWIAGDAVNRERPLPRPVDWKPSTVCSYIPPEVDPREALRRGEAIFCGKPALRNDLCREHVRACLV
jgi:hypothetical protein